MTTSDIKLGLKGRYWSRSMAPNGNILRRVPCIPTEPACLGCVGYSDPGNEDDCSMKCADGTDRIESIFIPLHVTREEYERVVAIARIEGWTDASLEEAKEDIPWEWMKDKDEL